MGLRLVDKSLSRWQSVSAWDYRVRLAESKPTYDYRNRLNKLGGIATSNPVRYWLLSKLTGLCSDDIFKNDHRMANSDAISQLQNDVATFCTDNENSEFLGQVATKFLNKKFEGLDIGLAHHLSGSNVVAVKHNVPVLNRSIDEAIASVAKQMDLPPRMIRQTVQELPKSKYSSALEGIDFSKQVSREDVDAAIIPLVREAGKALNKKFFGNYEVMKGVMESPLVYDAGSHYDILRNPQEQKQKYPALISGWQTARKDIVRAKDWAVLIKTDRHHPLMCKVNDLQCETSLIINKLERSKQRFENRRKKRKLFFVK